MSNVEKIAQIALLNARHCLEGRNYGRAFANFLLFLKLNSENVTDVYSEFALATREWCEQLEGQNRLEDLFKCYDQACEMFPDHDVVLNNIGAQLFRLGYIEEAAAYIRKSLLVNPSYLAARDNLENVCSHLVERWHFSMLNDKRRNIAFKFAIDKAIKSGYNTVLDIGTGTGILSMISEFTGALEVTACDGSRAMVDVALDVLQANGVHDKIKLLHKHSMDVQVPRDLTTKVKLVVTETFDAGLFGEHIVSTLIHAWKNLISTSPMGTIIPCGATMYVCGIECETIRTQSRLLYPVLQHLDVSHIDLFCDTSHVAEEPYTTENLAKIRGGYKILTNIAEFLRVSFCNLCELESLHKGKDWFCDLYVKQSGRMDALAVWFDLHLDDTITIATGADSKSCWEQAIIPLTSIDRQHANSHESCHVKRKEKVRTTFHFEKDCLRLTKCEVQNNQPKKNTTQTKDEKCLPSRASKTECAAPVSSGTSVKECSENCLPFRKRKVGSSKEGVCICACQGSPECRYETDPESKCESSAGGGLVDGFKHSCVRMSQQCSFEGKASADNALSKKTEDEKHGDSAQSVNAGTLNFEKLSDKMEDMFENSNKSEKECVSDNIDTNFESEKSQLRRERNEGIDNTCQSVMVEGSQVEECNISSVNSEIKNTDVDIATSDDVDMQIEMEKCSLDINPTESKKSDENVTVEKGAEGITVPSGTDTMPLKEQVEKIPFAGSYFHSMPKLTCYADQADIVYINDIQLNRQYCHKLQTLKLQKSDSFISLLYITPRLSFLGIQAAKMGYNLVTMAVPEEHHSTIHQVAALNGCKQEEVILMELSDLNELDMNVDVIVCDVVEPCGALRQQVLEDLVYHRVASLNSGGLILPTEVKVHGLFIESDELENLSHVTGNDRTLGFQIAEFINVFQMQNHMNIDMMTLTYTRLTDVQELLNLDLNGITMETTNCLDQTVEKSIEVVTSGKVTALVYWFELRLDKDTVISTLDSRCHWKQAGIMIKDDITMVTGQHILTKVTLQNSCLDVKIQQPNVVNGHI